MRFPRLFFLLALFVLAAECIGCGTPPTPPMNLDAMRALSVAVDMVQAKQNATATTTTPGSNSTPTTTQPSGPSPTPTAIPQPASGAPSQGGTVILVSIGQQWLWAYQDHQLVFNTPVTTGRPGMDTPTGTFTVLFHRADMEFTGWNPPEHVNYGLYFHDYGYYIHDATWRKDFGPGSNVPHEVDGQQETGSHGCVEVPETAIEWLYRWAQDQLTLVLIVPGPPAAQPTPLPSPSAPTIPAPALPHSGNMTPE